MTQNAGRETPGALQRIISGAIERREAFLSDYERADSIVRLSAIDTATPNEPAPKNWRHGWGAFFRRAQKDSEFVDCNHSHT